MEEEKDVFYVVRKGDIVGVYKSFNDFQSLLYGPDVAVFKGYRLSTVAENYLASRGLTNAIYSVGISNVDGGLFGQLTPCPFQQPNLIKDNVGNKTPSERKKYDLRMKVEAAGMENPLAMPITTSSGGVAFMSGTEPPTENSQSVSLNATNPAPNAPLSNSTPNAMTNVSQHCLSCPSSQTNSSSPPMPKHLIEEHMLLFTSFLASYEGFIGKFSNLDLAHEDYDQLDPDDLEEMDLQWNIAMITRRLKKFLQRSGKKWIGDSSGKGMGFDKSKVKCYECHNYGHFARECEKHKQLASGFTKPSLIPIQDVGSTSLSEAPQRKVPETESFIEALPVSAHCCSCVLEFDGAAKGNPGPAGAGVVLRAVDGNMVYRLREGLGVTTNNVAEYRAAILGLRYALDKGFRHIRVHGDSKLVCMQVNGLWKTTTQNMADLCKVVKELEEKFLSFEICHIEREYNSEADAQANLGVYLRDGEVQEEVDRR